MKRFIAVLALMFACAPAAHAAPLPALTFRDLDGGQHRLPDEWRQGGIMILGFELNARDAMDAWVAALGLQESDAWIEAPVIGNVPALVRTMIRSGMHARYRGGRAGHVAPVFDDTEAIAQVVGSHGDLVVLAIGADGEILGRADGSDSPANIDLIRRALRRD